MSSKEILDVFQDRVNHEEVGIACNLGFFKNGSKTPDLQKCMEIIKRNFLNNDSNIYLKNKKGIEQAWTPLMMCVYAEYYDGVNFFLDKGANSNMVGKDGKSALSIASIKNKPSIIKRLLKSKAEIDYQDTQGKTALMSACESGIFDNVKELVENKANIKIKNNQNQTCIDVGIGNKKYDIIKYIEHFYFDSVLQHKKSPEKAKTKI